MPKNPCAVLGRERLIDGHPKQSLVVLNAQIGNQNQTLQEERQAQRQREPVREAAAGGAGSGVPGRIGG